MGLSYQHATTEDLRRDRGRVGRLLAAPPAWLRSDEVERHERIAARIDDELCARAGRAEQ